ncbi:MAG: hypothetical protein ACR2LR_09105 [Hassallia sp.]
MPAKCYSVPKPIPEPSPLFGIGAIGIIGLATIFNRALMESKIKQIANG